MSPEFRLGVVFVLMILGGGMLLVLSWQSRKKGVQGRQFSLRTLMGWCFIWVLERLLVETFELGSLRWLLPVLGVVLSLGWYLLIFRQLSRAENQGALDAKIEEMGKKESGKQ